jgi:hypothetical protein
MSSGQIVGEPRSIKKGSKINAKGMKEEFMKTNLRFNIVGKKVE